MPRMEWLSALPGGLVLVLLWRVGESARSRLRRRQYQRLANGLGRLATIRQAEAAPTREG